MPLDPVGETLVALEREKWRRWNKDHLTWVEGILADEHLSIDATGGGVVERADGLLSINRRCRTLNGGFRSHPVHFSVKGTVAARSLQAAERGVRDDPLKGGRDCREGRHK